MKQTITETEDKKIIVTMCDNCGKEIGRNPRGDYKGFRCSICERQFCYDCHKAICIKDEDEMKHICPKCIATEDGSLQKMKDYQKKHNAAIAAKWKVEERWAERSNNYL
jgi:hypothetical protein